MNHLSSYEKCSRTNSHSTHHALRLIKLFFSEVEPHYFSTTWESLYPVPWEILQQLLNPSVLQAPCFHCSKEPQSLVLLSSRRWQACANSAAMSCGGWFLRSLFNCESAHEEKALLISTGWITIDSCQPSCVCGWSTFTNYIWIDQNSFPSFFENNWSTQTEYRIRGLTLEVWHTSHLQEWIFTTSNRRAAWNPLKSIITCFFPIILLYAFPPRVTSLPPGLTDSSGPKASFCQPLYWISVHADCTKFVSHFSPTCLPPPTPISHNLN